VEEGKLKALDTCLMNKISTKPGGKCIDSSDIFYATVVTNNNM